MHPRAERDGCDCAKQFMAGRYDDLLRCVHMDGERIALLGGSGAYNDLFIVQQFSNGHVLATAKSEADALAAFYAAEAELLGRAE